MKALDQELDRGWDWYAMRERAEKGELTEEDKSLIRRELHRFDVAEKNLEQLLGKARNQSHDMGILYKLMNEAGDY